MNASSVRVVHGKDGIPIMVRDEEPFFVNRWSDEETGFEYVDEYYLVFDFREGLLVEIVQRLIGGGEFSWEVPLDQIGEEALMRLKESGRLEVMREKVRETVRRMTENLDSLFFELKEGGEGWPPVTSVIPALLTSASGAIRMSATKGSNIADRGEGQLW